jgi:hypothetical protein
MQACELAEIRNGLIAAAMVTRAYSFGERDAALLMLNQRQKEVPAAS